MVPINRLAFFIHRQEKVRFIIQFSNNYLPLKKPFLLGTGNRFFTALSVFMIKNGQEVLWSSIASHILMHYLKGGRIFYFPLIGTSPMILILVNIGNPEKQLFYLRWTQFAQLRSSPIGVWGQPSKEGSSLGGRRSLNVPAASPLFNFSMILSRRF